MKVICSMVVSVDGFIADEQGDSVSTPPDWDDFRVQAKRYNNFVIGRNTFEKGGLDDVVCDFKVVVSSRPVAIKGFMTANSPQDVIAQLQGKVEAIYLVGGGKLNAAFLREGLIDEIVLTIQPKLVGVGIKLFDGVAMAPNLTLLSSETLEDNRVRLRYKVLAYSLI